MNITDIRQGIEDNLETVAGLRAYSEIPDNPQVPCAVVVLNSVSYDQSFQRGLSELDFNITVIVGRFSVQQAQEHMNDYAGNGAKSIKTAVQSDRTLGGSAADTVLSSMNGISALDLNDGNNYLGMEFSVTVYAN